MNQRVKESLKTALAMTIAFAIALSMDWDRPYWAGFTVAFISLSSVGQSLNKGAMRMLGTLVAFVVAILIIAMFAQQRWWFMVALSGWIGFCTYMMCVSKRAYFWFLAGFATAIIGFGSGTNPTNGFATAVLRTQETGLGVVVYTLVTTLLWPTNSRERFAGATRALAQAQHRLFAKYQEVMVDPALQSGELDQDTRAVVDQQGQALAQFAGALESALTDTYQVWELRDQWRRFQSQSIAMLATLGRWHESRKELRAMDLDSLLPGIDTARAELQWRFAEIERLLAGETLQRQPQRFNLSTAPALTDELSHFHKAALALACTAFKRLEELTWEQFDTVLDIRDLGAVGQHSATPLNEAPESGLLPDPDGLLAAARAMVSIWLAYVLWIYIEVPAGTAILSAMSPFAMIFATSPRLSPLSILKPVMLTIVFAGTLYVFVMPALSSFAGLGSMIFLVVFAIAYLFSTPKQGIVRAVSLALFLMIIGVSNQQHYNFLSVVDTALMFLMLIGLLVLSNRLFFSTHADKTFLRLLRRFFRDSEYLLSTMRGDFTMTPTYLDDQRRASHAREVMSLPQKLAAWGKAVDIKVLPGTSGEQVQVLTNRLQALAYCMQELMDARTGPQAELLVRELRTDVSAWRLKVQEALSGFSRDPVAATTGDEFRERLKARLELLEARIEETLNKAGEDGLSERDGEKFYRLLGAYRGLSEAVIDYAHIAEDIGWDRWQESRF